MNIVLFISAMQDGGAESVAATLVNAWVERGDSVTLVATYSGRGTCNYPVSERVKFVYLADLVTRRGRGPLAFGARFMTLRALMRDSRPDVIVSFLTNVNITTILASRGLGIPIIVSEHTNPLADRRSLFWKLMCRFVYPKADLLTLLTDGVVAPFRKVVPGMKDIAVMPNPLPDGLFQLERQAPAARKRVISLGRLHKIKQFDLMIRAFALLADEFPDWDLWIWGEGPERAVLEAQIGQLGMGGRIFLPGRTLTPWAELAKAQVFAMSSSHEGLPMALMESMAMGLPVVSFDCPSGPKELTRDGEDGLLIPPGDANSMAAALRRLISDDHYRAELGRKASISVRERYSLKTILRIWDELFERVGARPKDVESAH
ncbi:glycosyltransferase involved in cell wall biosynthesis [Paraburkholderia sp. BL8N3]|jgi:glycosyltransferase involved in cell wall biosynthesis|nr:glycosyltransferase family 4 protein [Paraburkholderia sp. BL8N3]TCK36529.1 glycosyltransferase involved in cell wall biosynthesis [Paraburkholderia sp. BL8N3]